MIANMIDVSDNNHPLGTPINWSMVANHGVKNVMIKATEGTDYINEWLERDTHGARAAGLNVGYYHFAQPHNETSDQGGGTQAEYFIKAIKGLPRNLGGALDLEVGNGLSWASLSSFAKAFLDKIGTDGVVNRILYTNPSWLSQLPDAPYGAELWLASWTPQVPRRKLWAWQFGVGSIPGVPGTVDLDNLYQ
jgi:lysozyme